MKGTIVDKFMKGFFALVVMCGAVNAHAFVELDGYVIATRECPAFQSIADKTNPGSIVIEEDRAYRLLGINKQSGSHFAIRIPAVPEAGQRWVSVACGIHVVPVSNDGSNDELPIDPEPEKPAPPESTDNVIALSWQPAFCEARPGKKECIALNEGRLPSAATRLSIHGLWAQPRSRSYCAVSKTLRRLDQSGNWHRLPALELSEQTRKQLNDLMPGTESYLHRHEWIKHGTCHFGSGAAEEYYTDTLWLTRAINESGLADYLYARVGQVVDTLDIRRLFDQKFGAGTGRRVQFHCTGDGKRLLLQELKISLSGIIQPQADLAALLLASDEVSLGCPSGIIDPAGLQ